MAEIWKGGRNDRLRDEGWKRSEREWIEGANPKGKKEIWESREMS